MVLVRPKEAKRIDSSTFHSRTNSHTAKTCVESNPSHGGEKKRKEKPVGGGGGGGGKNSDREIQKKE